MQAWNQALLAACPLYPNMRIYNWASTAAPNPDWFISDGIHYSTLGSQYRSADIATALAVAFPKDTSPTTTTTPTRMAAKRTGKTDAKTSKTSKTSKTAARGTARDRSTTVRTTTTTTAPNSNCVVNTSPSWPAPPS